MWLPSIVSLLVGVDRWFGHGSGTYPVCLLSARVSPWITERSVASASSPAQDAVAYSCSLSWGSSLLGGSRRVEAELRAAVPLLAATPSDTWSLDRSGCHGCSLFDDVSRCLGPPVCPGSPVGVSVVDPC